MGNVSRAIITNREALNSKYGGPGTTQIWNALTSFTQANDKLIDLAAPGSLGFQRVDKPSDPKQSKTAVDAIYKSLQNPDYLVIVGASDVVPFQDLMNTTADQDSTTWGDIPYACEASYSRDPANFRSPTRVIGRIPDLVRGQDPRYLIGLLDTASKYKSRPATDYQDHLGVSADVWKGSTSLSLQNIFGSSSSLKLSPPDGPNWSNALLSTRSHFINCHGAPADSHYYGQKGMSYPKAHSAAHIDGDVTEGTVAAAECCYGAELYDPTLTGGQPGICNTYLSSGGYGFFGSTTIAYGPANGNGAADLITQFFFKHLLAGASLGRATLQARQEYIQAEASSANTLDPVALKTLAQFYLLGDPSVHPVAGTVTHSKSADLALMKGVSMSVLDTGLARTQRRQELVRAGRALHDSVAYARRSRTLKPGRGVRSALMTMAENMKMKDAVLHSHHVFGGRLPKSAFRKRTPKRVLHVVHGEIGRTTKNITPSMILVAEEQEGKIVAVRRYYRR